MEGLKNAADSIEYSLEKYDPINLPIEFKDNGIRVKYNINILENQTSIHMWEQL